MTDPSAFLRHGFAQVQPALAGLADLTQAHLNPVTLARRLAQRARAELARLDVIVRRLLTLMALGLTLAPVRPRPAATPPAPAPQPDAADPICRKAAPGFMLTGKVLPGLDPDMSELFACTHRASGPVPAAALLARLAALQLVLADPAAHAQRLARALQRQQARGEARPVVPPMAGRHRMAPALGMIAAALPGLIRDSLKTWESSG